MMDEITADYSVEQLVEPVSLKVVPRVSVGAKTDLGRVRENNEDKFEFYIPADDRSLAAKGLVFVVCDGMGGHAAGQIASELACKTFIDVYLNHPSTEVETALRGAVNAANRYVYDVSVSIPGRKGMGTTLTALLLIQDRAYLCQVGDSRLYRLRNAELEQLSEDHTWIEDAIRQGMVSPSEADTHPYRHVLLRAIGTEPSVPCDIETFDLLEGDTFLLCSDGLINHVADALIAEELRANEPSKACWNLVGRALLGGGSDNCTVVCVHIDSMENRS